MRFGFVCKIAVRNDCLIARKAETHWHAVQPITLCAPWCCPLAGCVANTSTSAICLYSGVLAAYSTTSAMSPSVKGCMPLYR